ncbi:MAG TPA: RNA 2',3'-cyclic phosphodiesterase [Pyrinomonadaceae bacterium]
MSSKRVFIALDISSEARDVCSSHIATLRQGFRDVRVAWERPEKLHITLKFLGNTDPRTLGELGSSLRAIAGRHDAFRLRMSHSGAFPSKHRPRVLWIGVEDISAATSALHGEIEDRCRQLGFEEEGRRFRPHVTIGRVRDAEKARELCEQHLRTRIEPVEFDVSEIVIYESRLQSTGSVYSPISKVSLKAA